MSKHTEGKWVVREQENSFTIGQEIYGGKLIAETAPFFSYLGVAAKEVALANARRISACVNALEGLTTEQIEEGVFQKMREERDFLAAELYKATQEIKYWSEEVVKLKIERNHIGVAIDNAMRGILPDEHPLLSRLKMIANVAARDEHKAQLLEQINSASYSQYLCAADMLHDIKKIASRAIEDKQ